MTTSNLPNPTTPPGNPARKKALSAVAAAVVLAGIGYGAYWALVLNHFESTDNAYVQGNVVQVTPQMPGTVLAINADDTDHVKAGQWLVRLDPADAEIALEQAEANLAQTVRQVRTLYANDRTQQAQIAARQADLAKAQADLVRIQDDVTRRQPLVETGAVGREEFNHFNAQLTAARSTVEAARSGVLAAREQLASSQSLTDGIAAQDHPSVKVAAARVHEAALALQRTNLLAPVDGYVARRNVQLGQRVQAGAPLLSVIALDEVWVEANFKESQLKNLRLGQPVELFADVYGTKVIYHGVIEGLGAGTGAAFALLPAQNATGNWIKVVQRVPVRVKLDPAEVAQHPLRVGLSMGAKVDVSKTDGRMLADSENQGPGRAMQTSVFDQANAEADALVKRIITANGLKPESQVQPLAKATTASDRSAVLPVVTQLGSAVISAVGHLAVAN
ncbi:HlyD family efflux transporter periplasmic adaptor subunit [Hydrogenophaga crassostreae]|uniref:HlyD family secretion protein n=1 Tax=Hydrogenophaga crassostreae TaxID=1763535 RepID=A0A1D8NTN7_9BURK|nr:HlyD family efflux transporter periplasmic adaptor subunit [Hydrogenophaga crassostreae]AOW12474.1 HlyD family secretion protein [Hydrogenophaga crassostreae]